VQTNWGTLLQGNPNIGFYNHLHRFLKRWSVTQGASKALIGDLYLAIDPNLQAKGYQSNNAYRFIERATSSEHVTFDINTLHASEK